MINKYAMGIKAFFFDSIGHLPRNCLEVGARFEGSVVWVTGYIYKRAENQIFNLSWVSWASRRCLSAVEWDEWLVST